MTEVKLIQETKKELEVEHARVSKVLDEYFLILGEHKSTKDDKDCEWVNEKGEVQHWNYIHEYAVASAESIDRLYDEMLIYKSKIGKTLLDELMPDLPENIQAVVKSVSGICCEKSLPILDLCPPHDTTLNQPLDCCENFNENFDNMVMALEEMRDYYDGPIFKFCPWCGTKR
jgi:hypothetical protein